MTVHNDGSPIPTELLPHIFEPFRRAARLEPRRPARPSTNLGLGLHIVREIVDAHGGTIDVSSTITDGTTFAVHLPR